MLLASETYGPMLVRHHLSGSGRIFQCLVSSPSVVPALWIQAPLIARSLTLSVCVISRSVRIRRRVLTPTLETVFRDEIKEFRLQHLPLNLSDRGEILEKQGLDRPGRQACTCDQSAADEVFIHIATVRQLISQGIKAYQSGGAASSLDWCSPTNIP